MNADNMQRQSQQELMHVRQNNYVDERQAYVQNASPQAENHYDQEDEESQYH